MTTNTPADQGIEAVRLDSAMQQMIDYRTTLILELEAERDKLRAIHQELVAALRPLVAIVNGASVKPIKRRQCLEDARAALAKAKEQS